MSKRTPLVGCENEDGTLNIHPESETCSVCKDVDHRDDCLCDRCICVCGEHIHEGPCIRKRR